MNTKLVLAILLAATAYAYNASRAAPTVIADDSLSTSTVVRSVEKTRWSASARHSYARLSSERPSWRENTFFVMARFPRRTTVVVEAGQAERHAEVDGFVGADIYRVLKPGTYANVRAAVAPGARVMARADLYSEVFHAIGKSGWEASAGYRFARYRDRSVNTASVGIGRYVGNWYFRLRNSITPIDGSLGHAVLASARRYFSGGDEFVGVSIGQGREIVALPGDDVVAIRNSVSGALVLQRFLHRHAGIRLEMVVVDDEDLSRVGFLVGIVARW